MLQNYASMRCFILSYLCSFQGSTEFSRNKSMWAQHIINFNVDDKKLGSFQLKNFKSHQQYSSGFAVTRVGFSGGKRTRTADILLAKQALYQLSYTPNNEWAILDLNQGPHPYQGCALTTWANGPGETLVGCDLDKFRNWNWLLIAINKKSEVPIDLEVTGLRPKIIT